MVTFKVHVCNGRDPSTGLAFATQSGKHVFKVKIGDKMYTELKKKVRVFFGIVDKADFHFRTDCRKANSFHISDDELMKILVQSIEKPFEVTLIVVIDRVSVKQKEKEEEEKCLSTTKRDKIQPPETTDFKIRLMRGRKTVDIPVTTSYGVIEDIACKEFGLSHGSFELCATVNVEGESYLTSRTINNDRDLLNMINIKKSRGDSRLSIYAAAYLSGEKTIPRMPSGDEARRKAEMVIVHNHESIKISNGTDYAMVEKMIFSTWGLRNDRYILWGEIRVKGENKGKFLSHGPIRDDANLQRWIHNATMCGNDHMLVLNARLEDSDESIISPDDTLPPKGLFIELVVGEGETTRLSYSGVILVNSHEWYIGETDKLEYVELTRKVCSLFCIDSMNETFTIHSGKYGPIDNQRALDVALKHFAITKDGSSDNTTLRFDVSICPRKSFNIIAPLSELGQFVMHRECELGSWKSLFSAITFCGLLERLKLITPDAIGFIANILDNEYHVYGQKELDNMVGHIIIDSYYDDIPFNICTSRDGLKKAPETARVKIVFYVDNVPSMAHEFSMSGEMDAEFKKFQNCALKCSKQRPGSWLLEVSHRRTNMWISTQKDLKKAIRYDLSINKVPKFNVAITRCNSSKVSSEK